MKKYNLILYFLSLLIILVACGKSDSNLSEKSEKKIKSGELEEDVKKSGYVEEVQLELVFPEGKRIGIYTGVLKNGLPEGNGSFQSKNDEGIEWIYTGEWKDGKLEGQGECKWEDGTEYIGDYKAGLPHGVGKQYENNKLVYEGLVKDGNFVEIERTKTNDFDPTSASNIKFGDDTFAVPKDWKKGEETGKSIIIYPNNDKPAYILVQKHEYEDFANLEIREQIKETIIEQHKERYNSDIYRIVLDRYNKDSGEYSLHFVFYSNKENVAIDLYSTFFKKGNKNISINVYLGATENDYSLDAQYIKDTWNSINKNKINKNKEKLNKEEIYEYFMKLMDSPDNPENSVRDKSEDYDYDTTEWKKAREEYVDLCNKYFDKALNKTAKKYGITAKKVEEIWSDYEPDSDDEYDDVEEKAISSVLHGELLSANGSGGIDGHTLVVKVKIKPNLTNEMTIKQNYLNVEDIIRNKGGNSYNAIDYWAVADMNNGEEGKVISFTVNRDLIKQIVDLKIPVNKYGDYVDDLWILPSLLE